MFYWNNTSSAPKAQHPSLSWANWKNGKFMIWDREKQEEVEYALPKEFVVIADSRSVKGYLWDKGWVWSPEIYSFATDPLTIRSNNGEVLYEGLWRDIKDKVKAVGLKLTKNVHIFDPAKPDEIRTICIKWAGLKAWLETFADENRNAPAYKRIKLDKVADGKNGAVKYTYPVFAPATDLTADDRINQQKLWAELINYKENNSITAEEIEAKADVEEEYSELPF